MEGQERVGHGIFGWSGTERRTDRYGAFVLEAKPYDSSERVANHLDVAGLQPLIGKRVRVTCKVVANRESGHLGDLSLKIKPSKPEVGEVVDLGVGVFSLEPAGFGGLTAIVLQPGDGRPHFWIDPHKLYRLHDQTVDLFIEATDADFSPAPDCRATTEPEVIETGDGAYQAKGVTDGVPFTIPADIERLGDGLFVLHPPTGMEAGRRRKLDQS
jgi:hypothetical protein